ncbi:hypothetical protein HHUSO_G30538 [Huso huso]|uniref:Transmembrane protein n=1 Tax=Huso huso TaxID=61971 RepID=A0ABR0YEN9_HUSHU
MRLFQFRIALSILAIICADASSPGSPELQNTDSASAEDTQPGAAASTDWVKKTFGSCECSHVLTQATLKPLLGVLAAVFMLAVGMMVACAGLLLKPGQETGRDDQPAPPQ